MAARNLSGFSRPGVIFHFDEMQESEISAGASSPRPDYPNRLGVSICRLLSVDGTRLKVRGLDAMDGTPVLDIKPVMTGFLPHGETFEPEWVSELMKDYS